MMPARMFDLTAMRAPIEQPVICRDLVSCQDFSPEETNSLFELTHIIKHRPADFRGALAGKQLVLFFEKASLRTRLTFEAGMASLGGTSLFMDQTRSLLGEREPVCDIARNVERWVDAVVLRTFSHKTITDMARHTCIPVINALSDLEHPCQAFADFFTLEEKFGNLNKVHLAYVGDGNNVAHSLMLTAAALVLCPTAALAQQPKTATYITDEEVKKVLAVSGVDHTIRVVDIGNEHLAVGIIHRGASGAPAAAGRGAQTPESSYASRMCAAAAREP